MRSAEQPAVVQFIHRGVEHAPPPGAPDEGDFAWNQHDHGRKFLEVEATHLSEVGGAAKYGSVRLWGEWEPPSRYVRLPPEAATSRGPRFVHVPFLPQDAPKGWRQNTDPLVFGDTFTFSNCQQYKRRRGGGEGPTALWDLPPGSLLLFGSPMYQPKRFFLDTVIVVGERSTYQPGDTDLKEDALFKSTVAQPLASAADNRVYSRYAGRMWLDHPSGPYCFSPCLPVDRPEPWFPRPEIRPTELLQRFVTPEKPQGFKLTYSSTAAAMECWREITEQVLAAGLSLAVTVPWGAPLP